MTDHDPIAPLSASDRIARALALIGEAGDEPASPVESTLLDVATALASACGLIDRRVTAMERGKASEPVGDYAGLPVENVVRALGSPELSRHERPHPCTNIECTQEHPAQPAPPAERDRPAEGYEVSTRAGTEGRWHWGRADDDEWLCHFGTSWRDTCPRTDADAIAATHAHARERDRRGEARAEVRIDPGSPRWQFDGRHARELAEGFAKAVNRSSAEADSDTPDYVLGRFLADVLRAFGIAMRARAQHATPAPVEPEAPPAVHRSQLIRKGLYGGDTDPNRCVCAEKEKGPNAGTPHTHYAEPPHACARCRCKAYDPAVPPVEPTPAAQGARVLPPGYALYQRGVYWHWDGPDDEAGMHATSGVGEVSVADAIKGARAHAEQVETELRGAAGEETSK